MPPIIEILPGAILLGGAALWIYVLARLWRRTLRLTPPPLQVSWGLVDVVSALLLFAVFQAIGAATAMISLGLQLTQEATTLPPEALERASLAGGAANLLAVASTAAIVLLRPGGSWRSLGLDPAWLFEPARLLKDVLLGAAAFLMMAPVVYAVQWLFIQLMGESRHPLIETLHEHHPTGLLVAAGFAAIVAAPIAEEFLCRVLLQGWLEKLFAGGADGVRLLLGGDDSPPIQQKSQAAGFAAIAVSSLIFALLHATHGPDPIALFVLALGLGFLYRQTNRLLPCVMVHALNNAYSFAILVASFEKPP